MTSHHRVAAAAAIALSSLVVACGSSGGNGEDGKSADQIVKDAQAALKSATSFHLSGNISQDGNTLKIDMKVQDKDTTSGHLDEGDGIVFDFITAGGKMYFRGKQIFAKFSPEAAAQIGDRWVTVTGNTDLEGQLSSVSELSDASSLADSLGSSGGPYTKGGAKTVNGQQVVAVKGKDGELDVALNGKPYPVRLDAGSHGTMNITDYGASFGIKAPSGALDASDLTSSSSSTSTNSSTQAVIDATKVRDGVLQIAEATITSDSGSVNDAWGVGKVVSSKLPASVDVTVQTGDTSGLPAATPTHVVLYAAQTSSGDVFMVVVLDINGKCEVGALTGNPPNGNPTSRTLAAGTDCTAANGLDALQS